MTEMSTLETENYRSKVIVKYRHLSSSGNRALLEISYLFHFNRKMEFKCLLFCSSIDLFDVKDFKRNFKW